MSQTLVLDTLSSYDLGTMVKCVESSRCAVLEHYTLWGLRLLHTRDLASVVLATWALLLTCYLSLTIGMCRTRYTFRQLHAGDHNRVLFRGGGSSFLSVKQLQLKNCAGKDGSVTRSR
ncbi:unnamed protein product [Pylaiella littoralis]